MTNKNDQIKEELFFEVNIQEDKFIIKRKDSEKIFEIFRINKPKNLYNSINQSMKIFKEKEIISNRCYGIIGVFKSIKTDYLIIISNAEFIGEIFDSKILKIKKVKHYNKNNKN